MWIKEYPQEIGHYWFYGYRWKESSKKTLNYVLAYDSGSANNNKIIFSCNGQSFYKTEAGEGVWMRISEPKLPKE